MGSTSETLALLEEEMATAHQALQGQLKKLRTGRAHISLLDGLRVNFYGSPTPLNQCAQLSAAEARLLTIKPFDRNLITEIEKAIMASDLGVMPQNDGHLIRLPIPPLTEERRRELVKQAKARGEDAKIGLRNHRRDANEMLKESEKAKDITQDELKKALEQVQEVINRGTAQIDAALAQKEKEILEI